MTCLLSWVVSTVWQCVLGGGTCFHLWGLSLSWWRYPWQSRTLAHYWWRTLWTWRLEMINCMSTLAHHADSCTDCVLLVELGLLLWQWFFCDNDCLGLWFRVAKSTCLFAMMSSKSEHRVCLWHVEISSSSRSWTSKYDLLQMRWTCTSWNGTVHECRVQTVPFPQLLK